MNIESRVEKNINELTIGKSIKWGFIGIATVSILYVGGTAILESTKVAKVAQQEFGAEASIKKYEWFKTTAEQIKVKYIDIALFENSMTFCNKNDLSRVAEEKCMIKEQELLGIKSSYNDLVAEYNAQSSKFNWSLYNVDDLKTEYQRK